MHACATVFESGCAAAPVARQYVDSWHLDRINSSLRTPASVRKSPDPNLHNTNHPEVIMSHPSLSLSQLQDVRVTLSPFAPSTPCSPRLARAPRSSLRPTPHQKTARTRPTSSSPSTAPSSARSTAWTCPVYCSTASPARPTSMELTLLDGWESEELSFPVVRVDFSGADLLDRVNPFSLDDACTRMSS